MARFYHVDQLVLTCPDVYHMDLNEVDQMKTRYNPLGSTRACHDVSEPVSQRVTTALLSIREALPAKKPKMNPGDGDYKPENKPPNPALLRRRAPRTFLRSLLL